MAILYETRRIREADKPIQTETDKWISCSIRQALLDFGLEEDSNLEASMFKTAQDRVSPYTRRLTEDIVSTHPELAWELEDLIKFAAAVHRHIASGDDLATALIKEGQNDKEAYTLSGLSPNDTERHVVNSIGFAATIHIGQLPTGSNKLAALVTVAIPARSKARRTIFGH